MFIRARSFGDREIYRKAQAVATPSCDQLQKMQNIWRDYPRFHFAIYIFCHHFLLTTTTTTRSKCVYNKDPVIYTYAHHVQNLSRLGPLFCVSLMDCYINIYFCWFNKKPKIKTTGVVIISITIEQSTIKWLIGPLLNYRPNKSNPWM